MTFKQRCQDWLDAADGSTEEYDIVVGLATILDQIADVFHEGSSPNGWDVAIMDDVAAIMTRTGFNSRGPGFVDPDKWCWEDHLGPVSVSATEPIDDGVALTMKCGACGATSETSVSLDELDWRN